MSSTPNEHDTEPQHAEQGSSEADPTGTDEPIGVEVGMTDDGTTFEPEEDSEGAAE